ncbi:MAG: hypothetical protein IH588_07270 [Anaerolineales bacterium]|nr:hypothetical protein [Anaerolineales bacterium]
MLKDLTQLIQYSGPKRFLTSIGIILVILSFVLPWLMINQALAFDVKTADYDQLSQLSQYSVIARQSISLVLILSSCCLSPILIFFGISFSTISYWAWFFFGDTEKERKPSKSEKTIEKSLNLSASTESQQVNASFEIVTPLNSVATPKETNKTIKVDANTFLIQKTKEILSNSDTLKSQYSVESDDWFDVLLRSQSENPDILIKSSHIYSKDLWNIVRFYQSLIKEWADYNNNRGAKAVGIIVYPKLSLLSRILVWILNNINFILRRLNVSLVLFAEKRLNEKQILDMLQKNLRVNISQPK